MKVSITAVLLNKLIEQMRFSTTYPKRIIRFIFLLSVLSLFSANEAKGQSPCDLSNFTSAYILNNNDYPYFSASSGITVDRILVGGGTSNNFNYNCNAQTFSTASPAMYLNGPSPSQSLTFIFSQPVTSFSIVVNGTNTSEEFYFATATGSIQLSNFCTAGFSSFNGNTALLCFATGSATGTLITINNPTGSTSYTMTHNGVGYGSRYALLDCFVGLTVPNNNFTATNLCSGDSTVFDPTFVSTPDSVLWNFDDPGSGLANASTDTMPSHLFTAPGTYNVSLTSYIAGNPSTTSQSITINPSPIITATNTGPYCPGEAVTVNETGGAATSWSWTTNGSGIISNSTGQTTNASNVSDGDIFTVIGTDANGCIDSAQTTIVFSPTPLVIASNAGPYCAGDTVELFETGGDGVSWSWSTSGFGTIVSTNNQSPIVLNASDGDIFTVIVTGSNGCIDTTQTVVSMNPPPFVLAENTGPYCEGDTVFLNEIGGVATTWSWTTSGQGNISNNSAQNPFVTGALDLEIFTVTVTDAIGCTASAETAVIFTTTPQVIATNSGPYCSGDPITVYESGGDADFWQWTSNGSATFGAETNQTTTVFDAVDGEMIVVFASNQYGCTNSDTTYLSIAPTPIINFGPDTSICVENPYVLNAYFENATYLWQDSSTNATFTVSEPGTYWVIVTAGSCASGDEIMIESHECESEVIMPNVFTPNNDGINDILTPAYSKGLASMHTLIFNRWGNLVFESNDLQIGWNGGDLVEGTYTFVIDYVGKDGVSNTQHGYITLTR